MGFMALSEVDEADADEDCGAVAEVGDSWPAPDDRSLDAPAALLAAEVADAEAAPPTPFEVVALADPAGGGVRVAVDELFCWPSELFEDLRVLPTSRLNRELKVDDIGSCRHGEAETSAQPGQQRWTSRAGLSGSEHAKQIGRGEHRCDI